LIKWKGTNGIKSETTIVKKKCAKQADTQQKEGRGKIKEGRRVGTREAEWP